MISFHGTTARTQPATTGHISLWRDMIRDWRCWSRAERAAAVSILAAALVEISLGLAAGICSFI
jgi:uncharacterized membrane protein